MNKINFITSWDIKCGIADTTKSLVDELEKYDDFEFNVCPVQKLGSRNPIYFFKLLKNIQKNQITHIQYHSDLFGPFIPNFSLSYFPMIIFLLKFWRKNKVITTVHEIDSNSRIDRLLLKFLNLSDKLIAHNNKLIDSMNERGIKKDKLFLIPLGTSKGKLMDKEWCKNELGVTKNTVLTTFGFIGPNKGYDLIIDILPQLKEDCVLIIVGGSQNKDQNRYKNFLKEKISSTKLENRVKFLDFVEEEKLPVIANATDIFLYPYRWIIASAALSLALSYEVPTITSDLDYFKEIKREYDCVDLFKNRNRNDLLEKIQRILDSEEKQNHLKEKCKHFLEKTNWKVICDETRKLYLDLIY